MRAFTRVSKGLLATLAVAASMGLAGCGPDYAIFAVRVSSATPRNDIDQCRMTITNEKGEKVLDAWVLEAIAGQPGEMLKQGCMSEFTPARVGTFSYSTSRTSGFLTFKVSAYSATVPFNPQDDKPIQTVTSDPKEVRAFPPEVTVDLAMARTD